MQTSFDPIPSVPADTYQAAHKVYNLQHVYLRIGDDLPHIYSSINLSLLDPTSTMSLDTVLRLALVTSFQYAEALPDPLASEASFRRMDWKYALYLPTKHPGISSSALCQFRQNLYPFPASLQEFGRIVLRLEKLGLYARMTSHSVEPLEIFSILCKMTRLYRIRLAMKSALGTLVSMDPDWFRSNALPHWYERYKTSQLGQYLDPSRADLLVEANRLGADIYRLLEALREAASTQGFQSSEIASLARLFEEQYEMGSQGVQWRLPACANCAINSTSRFEM